MTVLESLRDDETYLAALAIRDWAASRNLLRRGGTLPATGGPAAGTATASAAAFSAAVEAAEPAGLSALERISITAVGVNPKRRTVVIYTPRRLTKKAQAALPSSLTGGLSVEFRQAKPVSIGIEGAGQPVLAGSEGGWSVGTPYPCGSSIGMANTRMAGTFGALVRGEDGALFGLSNNHVTGGCSNARPGLPILAPGVLDVTADGPSPFCIGRHHGVLPMVQGFPGMVNIADNTDAALFAIEDPRRVSSMQGDVYDTPSAVADPEVDMVVEKVGRTTGHTVGVVEAAMAGEFPVSYTIVAYHGPDEEVRFNGLVYFTPVFKIDGQDGPFSLSGDSGSLVVGKDASGRRAAVGLVFAGLAPDESYMLPLRPILERFGVTLVSGHNA
jgi:hypothetical protein